MKIFKERFIDVTLDELNIESCKVILCNPPDSRSALIQPLDFLYHEGEGVIRASAKLLIFCFVFFHRYIPTKTILTTNRN